MSLICRIGGSLIVALAVACSSDGISGAPSGFPHSFARSACGPADGPAVAIYLTPSAGNIPSPTPPYVRVYIARSVDELNGRVWAVAGSSSEGGAWFQSRGGGSEAAKAGYIIATTKTVGSDKSVEGSFDMTFPSVGRLRGGFRAPLFPNNALCA